MAYACGTCIWGEGNCRDEQCTCGDGPLSNAYTTESILLVGQGLQTKQTNTLMIFDDVPAYVFIV